MASESNLKKVVKETYKSSEHGSSFVSGSKSSIGTITNTLYRANVKLRAYSSTHQVLGETSLRASDGFGWVNTSQDISYYVFVIPKASLPQSGKYKISVDFGSDFTQDISSVRYRWTKTISSASTASGFITPTGLRYNNAGEFYDSGTYIDLSSNFTELRVHVNLNGSGYRNVGGYFFGNLSLVTDPAVVGEIVGTEYNTDDNTSTMVQQNEQILEEQQETNGLLAQIIQHISDQLYALWNQLYNIMALPWKQEQHNDSLDTQEAIEDIGSDITGSIEQHGNFIINGLKSLFIPDADFFSDYFDDLYDFFEDHLGVLSYPFTLVIRILNAMADAIDPNNVSDGAIYFPGVKLEDFPVYENGSLTSSDYVFVPGQTIRLDENVFVNRFISTIRFATSMLLIFSVISLAQRKIEEVLRN